MLAINTEFPYDYSSLSQHWGYVNFLFVFQGIMNMVHYISQSCRNNLSLGESYSSWLTRVTRAVRWKMNAQALPNSQGTALWRGEAETGSNRYFLDGTFFFTEGLLGTEMSQNCWMLPMLLIPQVQVQWHRDKEVHKLAGQLPSQRSK